MSLSVAMSIGFVVAAALALGLVWVAWRRKRNRVNDELRSEMATHLWSTPPIMPRAEGPAPLDDVSRAGKEARTAPEATQPNASARSVVLCEEGPEVPLAVWQQAGPRPRLAGRHHLLWEVVGAEAGLRGMASPQTVAVGLTSGEPREPVPSSVGERPKDSIETNAVIERSELVEQTRRQLEGEVLSALQTFSQQVETRLRTFEEGLASAWISKLQAAMTEQAQKLVNDFREGHYPSLQSAAEELDERVKKQLDVAASGLVEQTRSRLQGEVCSALETFSVEIGRRLRSLEEEQFHQFVARLRAEVVTQVQEQLADIQNVANDACQQVSLMTGRITPLLDNRDLILRSAQASDRDLKECADAAAKRIDLSVATAVEKLRTFENQTEARLGEVVEALRHASDDLTASWVTRLERQLGTMVERKKEELSALQAGLLAQAKEQLSTVIQAPLESVTREAEAITEQHRRQLGRDLDKAVRKSAQELDANGREVLERQRELLQKSFGEQNAAGQASLESLRREAEAIVEECRARLRQEINAAVAASPLKPGAGRELVTNQPDSALRPMELYQVSPPKEGGESIQTRRGHGLDAALHTTLRAAVWLLPITPIILFVILSVRPVTRLRSNPPAEFFAGLQGLSGTQQTTEERITRAYWDAAVRHVQAKYQAGTTLPNEPLPEFRVEGTAARREGSKSISDTRNRYWGRLREVWVRPGAWETSYVWDTGWIDAALTTLQRAGQQLVGGAR